MRVIAWTICAVVGVLGISGCSRVEPGELGVSRASLRAVEGCEDLEHLLRESAILRMREEILANYESALEGDRCWDYGDEEHWASADGDADGDTDGDGDPTSTGEGAEEYSTTNTQEVGVDEADFVKNDGSYIYIVSGNEFLIIDAWPASSADIITRVELEGRPRLLYVHEDHALIYSDITDDDATSHDDCYWDEYGDEYICGATSQGTRLTVLDITDRETPRLVREVEVTGRYVNSRRVEDTVHTVMTYPEISFPEVTYWPEGIDMCTEYDRAVLWHAFSLLMRQNEEIIINTPLEDWVPSISDTQFDSDGTPSTVSDVLGNCEGFYEAVGSSGRSFLSVVSFDLLHDDGDINVSSIVGDQGVVYASREALYVASRQYENGDGWYYDDGTTEATTVHRFAFDLDAPTTTYEASGVVPGRILNQFSMGEHRGFLRLATTIGYLPSPDCSNNVYVLEPRGGELAIAGEVTGIAPTEDIRSARFVGDRGFIVTFKKTDPLFTIDLSNPTNPRIVGELHIPGYSTYMHMMDSEHLLTIGFDAQDEGSFAWFQGVQLQIFDVSDMSNPTRTHIEIIGTRGTTSEATSNHLAFNYFAPHDLLAIPMGICEGGSGGGSYGDVMTFNGLMVFDVTVDDGFSEHGRVSHGEAPEGYSCSNWWTTSNSHVKRSIIMDDFVFSIADDQIIVSNLADLSSALTSIELPLASISGDSSSY